MLVRFIQKSGDPVAVNPALVRKVKPGSDGTTVISFEKEDQIWVQASFEEAMQLLEPDGSAAAPEAGDAPAAAIEPVAKPRKAAARKAA